eukprot:6176590-Pleurochrysis_carterae.AAC.4
MGARAGAGRARERGRPPVQQVSAGLFWRGRWAHRCWHEYVALLSTCWPWWSRICVALVVGQLLGISVGTGA